MQTMDDVLIKCECGLHVFALAKLPRYVILFALNLPMQSCLHAWPSLAKVWQTSVFRPAILLMILGSMVSLRSCSS